MIAEFVELVASGAEPVVEKTGPLLRVGDGWSRFGIRDPCLHVDRVGEPLDPDRPTIFFNGRDRPIEDGGRTQVGRACWNNHTFEVDAEPAYADGAYAACGSVVEDLLFYSPDTKAGFAVAESGHRRPGLILTPPDFGCTHIGLPHVVAAEGRWLMVLEGVRNQRFAIYGASSEDATKWTPLRDGEPLYVPDDDAWDAFGQANPSLHVHAGTSVIVYNGKAARDDWDVGWIVTDDLESGRWRTLRAPLLERGPPGSWDAGRLEGARPFRDGLLYFGLPSRDSYRNGAIGFARLRK